MDLTPYVDGLRRDLAANAAVGGDAVAKAGELLASALDPAARMRLLEALGDAATEVTAALDDAGLHHTEVQVHLQDRQATFAIAVTAGPESMPPMDDAPLGEPSAENAEADGGATARITLRLPERLKGQVEQAAADEGISVNAWLVRAVSSWVPGEHGPHHGPHHGPPHGPPGAHWSPGWGVAAGPWGAWIGPGGRPGPPPPPMPPGPPSPPRPPGSPGRRGRRITGYSQT